MLTKIRAFGLLVAGLAMVGGASVLAAPEDDLEVTTTPKMVSPKMMVNPKKPVNAKKAVNPKELKKAKAPASAKKSMRPQDQNEVPKVSRPKPTQPKPTQPKPAQPVTKPAMKSKPKVISEPEDELPPAR